jgi:hypothetical protein
VPGQPGEGFAKKAVNNRPGLAGEEGMYQGHRGGEQT